MDEMSKADRIRFEERPRDTHKLYFINVSLVIPLEDGYTFNTTETLPLGHFTPLECAHFIVLMLNGHPAHLKDALTAAYNVLHTIPNPCGDGYYSFKAHHS